MNPFSIPPALSALLFLALGGFIFFQNRKSIVNFTFLLICLTTAWWQGSWFLLFNTQDETLADILVKVGHIGIILLPVTFLHFFLSFLRKTDWLNKIFLYASYGVTLFFIASLFSTDYLINGYYQYFWGFYPKANFLHPIFLLFIAILLLRVIYLLIATLKKEPKTSLKRSQIEYMFIAIIFYTSAASDFIVNYGYEFYPIGFLSLLLFLGTIGYAIATTKLFNVKVVLTQLLVGVISILLFANFLTSQTSVEYLWKGGLLIAFLGAGYLLIKSVMNEIKQREELQRAYAKLKELDEAKSEFVSIASHQLRTPLTAIKGYISMILEGSYGALNETQGKPMKSVYESNERLIRLVNDLLNISRIESGRVDTKWAQKNIGDIIKSVIEEIGIKAQEKKLKIVFKKPEETLPEITLDEEKIRNVLLNVVDNAIRYTKKGKITINVKNQMSNIKTPNLLISVKDTGDGMTQEEINHLFESFSRGGAGTRMSTEGAGLGLYIAKQFVNLHKGKIWAESQGRGEGSTFFIELPVAS